ncbi:hypothetical protein ACFWPK_27740 [Nocardia sp. NPDC058519]|uniref:hypothetical protein n=1 Tax=Nocardia sp. NPDC058519 TaxID=3346535 RepID=UPI003656A228
MLWEIHNLPIAHIITELLLAAGVDTAHALTIAMAEAPGANAPAQRDLAALSPAPPSPGRASRSQRQCE